MTLIFFLFLVQFPVDCSCFQVASIDEDADLFYAAREIVIQGRETSFNDGYYAIDHVSEWLMTGLLVVLVHPPPPFYDLHGHRYDVAFDPYELHLDGFEAGDFSAWSQVAGGAP